MDKQEIQQQKSDVMDRQLQIIHFVLGKANPNRMNGVNKVANSLCTAQTELGNDVTVWGITEDPNSGFPERNYKTRLFKANRLRFILDPNIRKAVDELKGTNVIFHIHGGFIPEFYTLSKMLKRAEIPYIITGHGAYNKVAMKRSWWRKRLYFALFEKSLVANARSVHFLGESEKSGLRSIIRKFRYALIPNGQDKISQTDSIDISKTEIRFGFCGRLDIHTKGLDLLLKGFSRFVITNSKARLILIGDGADREQLEALSKELGISDKVEFKGSRFGQEKYDILASLDAFFHPSRNEGLPTAVLEAAALGVPCVVSEETNMRGYIQAHSSGIGLQENTAEKLTGSMVTIAKLKRNGEIARLQHNCEIMIRNEFDWNIIANRLVKTYMQPLA